MKFDIEKIMARANELYAQSKFPPGFDFSYMCPEQRPEIRSDQVKSILRALVEALNS